MNYRVLWTKKAREQLAEIWLNSAQRSDVVSATNAIDALLGISPGSQGESRDDGRRVTFEWPLVVYFKIDEPGKRVIVSQIRPM